eukprot:7402751-Alexandrium_andersonii.AAC.1
MDVPRSGSVPCPLACGPVLVADPRAGCVAPHLCIHKLGRGVGGRLLCLDVEQVAHCLCAVGRQL